MNPISHPLSWKFQKNRHVLEALLLRNAPSFVWEREPAPLADEIPVFTFHTAEPDGFEAQCRHLAENGYRALSADEFAAALAGARPPSPSVLLTFDDGLASVWTVAWPLLRKYGLQATCFLIPGCIPEGEAGVRPTLADVGASRAERERVLAPTAGPLAFASWAEVRAMHESGAIQFESHTMFHALVHSSDRIFDFVNPDYDPYFYANIHVPVYQRGGEDVVSREPVPGAPIYRARPRMSAERRFFDDEAVRECCVETVAREGGAEFFRRKGWRARLERVVSEGRRGGASGERWETPEQRDAAIGDELRRARAEIEARLPGRSVTQLCYPWYEAGEFAVEASRRSGYTVNYFGQLRGRRTNRPGDDPMHTVRVEEMFLERLPGAGRKSLRATLGDAYLRPHSPRPDSQRPDSQRPEADAGPSAD